MPTPSELHSDVTDTLGTGSPATFTPSKVPEKPSPSRNLPRDSLLLNAPDSSRRYFMNHESRGIALIINNQKFARSVNLGDRHGSSVDATALEDTFKTLGFTAGNIYTYTDVTCKNMVRLMDHFASTDFSGMDCFFCVILSHGKENVIYAYDGKTSLDLLLEPFKQKMHPSLVGKPKIFLVQACRGDKLDHGQDLLRADNLGQVQRIPLEADFLYAYSTVPGYYSWRNAIKGSWFIQAFVKNVEANKRNSDMDLVRLLTRVNYDVAYQWQSSSEDVSMHGKKQMPSIVSMLTKDLFFFAPT